MNTYLIEHKIRTLSNLSVGLDDSGRQEPMMIIDDYIFEQWDFNFGDGWIGDAWVVSKSVTATTFLEAIKKFRNNLDLIIQKVGFVSQCYMDFYGESFLILKENDNDEKIFLYRHFIEVDGIGLHFGMDELGSYEQLKSFEFVGVFRFLQESRNVVGFIPKLVLLFSALEAMCDRIECVNDRGETYFKYNTDTMKEILGNNLFDILFGTGGIRHKLDHGEFVVFSDNLVEKIYTKIVEYFNKKCDTDISLDVTHPQRNFYGNKGYIDFWLQPLETFEPCLRRCELNYNEERKAIDRCKRVYDVNTDDY